MALIGAGRPNLLPPGTVLDERFEIKEFLGAGSFGAVYRASQLVFGVQMRNVALKLFKADKVTARNMVDVLGDAIALIGLTDDDQCPAEIARRLVPIYDIGVLKHPAPQAYLSMKLIPGGRTLDDAVRRWRDAGGMAIETALRFVRQLLEPLAWMHTLETPAVHGDLKPDNVLLTRDSEIVLTDFGLAGRLPLGSVGGAIQYQAPETLLGGVGGAPADVYGVGLIWYEMLTGRHPFANIGTKAVADGNDRAFVHAHFEARKWPMLAGKHPGPSGEEGRIIPPAEFNQEMRDHPQLEQILGKCLSFKESERYPNAKMLLDAIDRYARTGVAPPEPSHPVITPPSMPRGKTPEALVGDVTALLAGGQNTAALAQAEALRKLHPDYVPGLLVLARVLTKNRRFRDAQSVCADAQTRDRKNPECFEMLAEIFQAEGQTDTAAGLRQQAVKLRSVRRI